MDGLDAIIRDSIRAEGPISVARYMQFALQHPDFGYYAKGDPIGARGDFITAPEISQLFGEMIGLWCAEMWRAMGQPDPFVLLELGPGRGTLMADALRATERVAGFHAAMRLHLLESNETLRAVQQEKLKPFVPTYIADLCELPAMPLIVVANEFFDAMPVHQYRKTPRGWREVMVGLNGDKLDYVEGGQEVALPFPDNLSFFEVSPVAVAYVKELAARFECYDGAALIVDYGYAAPNGQNTLQAVAGHDRADPLNAPGKQDLTAHVDFMALRLAAEKQGAYVPALLGQGDFLRNLGVDIRANQLRAKATTEQAAEIGSALGRLVDDDQMGTLFKAMVLTRNNRKDVPGFP